MQTQICPFLIFSYRNTDFHYMIAPSFHDSIPKRVPLSFHREKSDRLPSSAFRVSIPKRVPSVVPVTEVEGQNTQLTFGNLHTHTGLYIAQSSLSRKIVQKLYILQASLSSPLYC